jgi:hypothetical protein
MSGNTEVEIGNEQEAEEVIDPIEVIYVGECESLSGMSMLTYAIGRHTEDSTLHLRIKDNSGGGMWCKDWASASDIQSITIGATGLTSKSFHPLHSGRSINTGGFILAVLKDIGLIRPNEENTRVHDHVPTTTLQQLVMARLANTKDPEPRPGGKKGRAH